MTKHWSDAAIKATTLAARKCGADMSDITIKYATLDRTWGDKVGLVVFGGTPELRARVASYLTKWLTKHLTSLLKRGYDQQISVDSEPRNVAWLPKGATGTDGVAPMTPPSYYSPEDKADYVARIKPALGIGCVYYPCND